MLLDEAIDKYHAALGQFAKRNPEPVKELYSRRGDVTLANPFGPAVRGWELVSNALNFASSRFRDGDVPDVESLARYITNDLASMLDSGETLLTYVIAEEDMTELFDEQLSALGETFPEFSGISKDYQSRTHSI